MSATLDSEAAFTERSKQVGVEMDSRQIRDQEASRIALVFISLPCGTASKATERPIKTSLLAGRKQPLPLRTRDKPDQKDGLSHTDKVKTELANQF